MTRKENNTDDKPNSLTRTKYLHVEIPEELFKQAKIQALQSGLTWTKYICGVLESATNSTHHQNEKASRP